ncbi:TadE family protein [Streptomyces armeniacus]|uniref:TadE family protein n=1 Tax=Streptomyces armeniacus TaxID=83291 RepID=UPI0026D23826
MTTRRTALRREARGERGSATVEMVAVTPLLILLALTVVGLGRLVDARLVVGDAAHQAARAASLARTENAARDAAHEAASTALRDARSSCTHPQVQLDTGGLRPGGTVSATVSCTADLGDLTRSGMPGSLTLSGEAISPVDTYRSAP